MTRRERRTPKLLNASRKKRVSAGSGSTVQEVNQLLKMHRQMADMMKSMSGKKGKGMMGKMAAAMGMGGMPGAGAMPGGGGMPGGMGDVDPKQLEQMAQQMGSGAPRLPGLGGPKLPGLGGGGSPFGKKK